MYNCSSCNYYLHKACSQMPQNKKHQIDPQHTLTLLSSPAYAEGAFKCNACGQHGTGFCYHCKERELDFHTLRVYMPSSKAFQCAMCKGSSSNHWLYRCERCNFDAHLNCAISNIQSKPASGVQQKPEQQHRPTIHHLPSLPMLITNQQIWIPYIQTSGNLIPVVVSSSRSQPAHKMGGYCAADVPILVGSHQCVHQPPRSNKISDNNLMGLVMKGVVDGVAEQAGQILLGTILGGFHPTDDQ
ncbi:hypothetical protein P3X46_009341 [Hevea brasiliensis]|uniref:DC1 domain-containing protein n=1 Tax=Hevea brasiliensis TaxID=3981 RepID=A0ABQ9MLJ3_HEVBR|nr:hypothetical protein P3X46_009341 [Hevea brasiliensis]